MKALLFPLVEMFPQVGGEQAADAFVRDENIKVVQQASFGFKWFVLFLQHIVWDDLVQMEGEKWRQWFATLNTLYSLLHFTVHMYLCDTFYSVLLQHLLVEPLCLFWRHFGLVSDEEANLVCVCTMSIGQGAGGDERVTVRFTWQSLRRHGYDPDPRRITHMRMVWAFLGILHRVKSRLMGCESSSNRDLEAEVVFRKACKACTAFFTWHRHRGIRFKTPFFKNNF